MNTTHTPGAWKRKDFTCADGQQASGVISQATGGAVCWPTGVDEATTSANACLICAAPDLLAQLIYLRRCVELGEIPTMGNVNKAISKALGVTA